MHSEKKREEDTGKEEIKVFFNQEKGGVDSHDQMCSLYTSSSSSSLARQSLVDPGLLEELRPLVSVEGYFLPTVDP